MCEEVFPPGMWGSRPQDLSIWRIRRRPDADIANALTLIACLIRAFPQPSGTSPSAAGGFGAGAFGAQGR